MERDGAARGRTAATHADDGDHVAHHVGRFAALHDGVEGFVHAPLIFLGRREDAPVGADDVGAAEAEAAHLLLQVDGEQLRQQPQLPEDFLGFLPEGFDVEALLAGAVALGAGEAHGREAVDAVAHGGLGLEVHGCEAAQVRRDDADAREIRHVDAGGHLGRLDGAAIGAKGSVEANDERQFGAATG